MKQTFHTYNQACDVYWLSICRILDILSSFSPTTDSERKTQTFLDKQEAFIFFFISGKQNHSFIHYNPDYAQSSILSAQFKSKVIRIRI